MPRGHAASLDAGPTTPERSLVRPQRSIHPRVVAFDGLHWTKSAVAVIGHRINGTPLRPTAELVRLSRTSIADEMREEHRRRVLGESDRPRRRKAAGGHRGFEAVSNVHNEVTICALKPLREGETGHAHFWIPRRQLSDRLFFCASADRDGRHGACCSTRHNPIIASADSR